MARKLLLSKILTASIFKKNICNQNNRNENAFMSKQKRWKRESSFSSHRRMWSSTFLLQMTSSIPSKACNRKSACLWFSQERLLLENLCLHKGGWLWRHRALNIINRKIYCSQHKNRHENARIIINCVSVVRRWGLRTIMENFNTKWHVGIYGTNCRQNPYCVACAS